MGGREVLPMRSTEGVVVRYVYPGSGAAKAGFREGDRIEAGVYPEACGCYPE